MLAQPFDATRAFTSLLDKLVVRPRELLTESETENVTGLMVCGDVDIDKSGGGQYLEGNEA